MSKRYPVKIDPRHVYVASFDSDDTDVVVLPSHKDIAFNSDDFEQEASGVSDNLYSIWHDEKTGVTMACGDAGTILKSVNGGDSWSDISPGSPYTQTLRTVKKWRNYWFVVGWGNSTTPARILRSDDDGATWDSINTTTPSFLVCIGFSDEAILFGGWDYPFSNTSALIIRSGDGVTFNRTTIGTEAGIYGIEYHDGVFAFVGSGASSDAVPYFSYSNDNGISFNEVQTAHDYSIWSVVHTGENWVTASGQGKFKWSPDLLHWYDADNAPGQVGETVWRMTADYQGNIYVCGGEGTSYSWILKSVDHGKTFSLYLKRDGLAMLRKGYLVEGHFVAVGNTGTILKSGLQPAAIYYGTLTHLLTTSQSIDPIKANAEVGGVVVGVRDDNKKFSRLLNHKVRNGLGLRGKRLQHWIGVKGGQWPGDYRLVGTYQFHGNITYDHGSYILRGQDIQRQTDVYVFDQKETTLTADANWWDITLSVSVSLDTLLIAHDSNFTDAPSRSVAYVQIENEVIRITNLAAPTISVDSQNTTTSSAAAAGDTVLNLTSGTNFRSNGWGYIDNGGTDVPIRWTGKSGNQLTGVTGITAAINSGRTVYDSQGRGVLNTKPADHTVDTDQATQNRTVVKEYHYYEMNPIKLAYWMLTGTSYGTSDNLPSHCQVGLPGQWISTSQWVQYSSLWDPADDTVGPVFRFEGMKKTNFKKFLEEQLLFWVDTFPPVLPSGELGLRRMTRVLKDSPYTRYIDESRIISINSYYWDFDAVVNRATIPWNFNPVNDDYTRKYPLIETNSRALWGESKELILPARGIHGSRFSKSLLLHHFEAIIDGYAYPPLIINATLDYTMADLKVGEVVRVNLINYPEIMDDGGDYKSLDISMRVDHVDIDHENGYVEVKLFGSTGKVTALSADSDEIMADAFYGSGYGGTDIASVTTGSWSAGVGSTWTITANYTFNGNASMNNAGAKFYLQGDLVIGSNVTVTLDENVQIRAYSFTNNGFVNAAGGGMPASAGGNPGGVGACKSGGGVTITDGWGDSPTPRWFRNNAGTLTEGEQLSTPVPVDLRAPTNTTLTGIPDDLRGTGGAAGGDVAEGGSSSLPYLPGAPYPLDGGAGGAGGAGLCIITRSFSQGANGYIDLSGLPGQPGELSIVWETNAPNANDNARTAAGGGAGGAPGGFLLILDGALATVTDLDQITANQGTSPLPINPWSHGEVNQSYSLGMAYITPPDHTYISPDVGFGAADMAQSMVRVVQIPDIQTIEEDTALYADLPTDINIGVGTNESLNVNWFMAEISVDAPADANFAAARIYWRVAGGIWTVVGDVGPTTEIAIPFPINSGMHYFRAHSISNVGNVSPDYIIKNWTAPTSLNTIIPDGSTLIGTSVNSGNAADETLVPNGFFDFPLAGTWQLIQGTAPATPISILNDVTEGNYLNLTNDTGGYGYGSRTFRLIPGSRYRIRIRIQHDGTGDEDGFYFYLQHAAEYLDLITPVNRDGTTSLITGTDVVVPDSWETLEFNYTAPAGAYWGNIGIWNHTQSAVDFEIAFIDVVPWGALSFWDAFIPGGSSYNSENIYYDENVGEIGHAGITNNNLTTSQYHSDYVELIALSTLDTFNTGFQFYRANLLGLDAPSWNKNRFLLFMCAEYSQVANQEIYIGTGKADDSAFNQISIKCAGTSMYGRVCNGSTCTESSAFSGVTWSGGATFRIEIRFYAGSRAEFYVDDVLKATITTNLPTDAVTSYRDTYFSGFTYNNGSLSSANGGALVGDFRFIQVAD